MEGNGFFANWLALVTMIVEFIPIVKGHFEELAHGGVLLVNTGDFEKLAQAGTQWRLAGSCASPGEQRGAG